jgi:iron complex outermembrane receptor protein/hemoglobin/transferrin/lactoferrin receptor protein
MTVLLLVESPVLNTLHAQEVSPVTEDSVTTSDADADALPGDVATSDGGDSDEVAPETTSEAEPGEGSAADVPADDESVMPVVDYSSMTRHGAGLSSTRATTRVTEQLMEERVPRSAPDALRYEPGVFVQQTAHAQGSPFIRGRTGQQTVILFDSVRLNNSLFRQGPNQYFFTIDSRSIESIDVLRGSASTRFGSDAMAGVISANPIEPEVLPEETGLRIRPRLMLRYGSADNERGGRAQAEFQAGPRFGGILGFGYRDIDELRSGGPVYNPRDGELPEVPRFDQDGKTQLGTGFREFTGDARFVWRITPDIQAIFAWYEYRQRDAPRTDQCAPPFAPSSDCLTYEEQDRQLGYTALEGRLGDWARSFRLTLSWQRQHERRSITRPTQFTENIGRDDVTTLGVALYSRTSLFDVHDDIDLMLRYGGDVYHDAVSSAAWLTFTDVDITRERSRGQYLDDSRYVWGGVFSELEAQLWQRIAVRTGGRVSVTSARAPGDGESGTAAVDQTWLTAVANAGLELWATDATTVTLSLDQGYRAPNLDDLTSRQQTGPGFQIENAALQPERSLTAELGVQVRSDLVTFDSWVYHTTISDGIARSRRESSDCPPETLQCASSWSRFQLINTEGASVVYGAEGGVEVRPVTGLSVRTTIAYAYGEGPNTQPRPVDSAAEYVERVPLSRVPPLNGTAEVMYRHSLGWYAGAAMRWATLQDRLANSDLSDARIPLGGTPGFAVFDVRAGYRLNPWLVVAVVGENLGDAAYRYHGSSVNGPGRSVLVSLEAGL